MSPLRILDDRERELVFTAPPRRVVSLVPSDTDSLFALGAGERLVGRTRFCVAPEGSVERIPAVGGTKDARPAAILGLQPDLVLANQEENTPAVVQALAARGVPVLVSFPRTVAAGFGHLARLARVLGLEGEEQARRLVAQGYRALRAAEEALAAEARAGREPLATFAPIWMEPLMTVSGETFLSDLLRLAGAGNVFAGRRRRHPLAADQGRGEAQATGDRDTRYPRITLAEVAERAPALVLLPDEPYPFGAAEAAVFRRQQTPAARAGKVVQCSGRDLSWHGAHAVEALPRVRALIEAQR